MKSLSFLLFIFSLNSVTSQIVISSCSAPDSILKKYRSDADRLAISRVFKVNSTFADSIKIDKNLSNSYLNALVAVHNATTLAARDTIVNQLKIHRYIEDLNTFFFKGDSNLIWMKNLRNNIIPTGESFVDYLMTKYYLQKNSYSTYGFNFLGHGVVLKTDTSINTKALAYTFSTIPNVTVSLQNAFYLGGKNISDSININFTELTYGYGWGDCYSGCIYHRYWKFKVYNNCSVEYTGSYGNPLLFVGIREENIIGNEIKLYPNPTTKEFFIESSDLSKISISNYLGQIVFVIQDPTPKQEIDISSFQNGVYFAHLTIRGKNIVKKILVNH